MLYTHELMLTRRNWIRRSLAAATLPSLAGTGFVLGSRRSHGAEPLQVEVKNHNIGAIVAAVGGSMVQPRLAVEKLDDGGIRVENVNFDITETLRLKGEGDARGRFLDDPRNATKVAANIRNALIELNPGAEQQLRAQTKAWSRALIRRVLPWSKRLAACPFAGKSVRDENGRVYLLQWAGARIDPTSTLAPVLGNLPVHAKDSTPAAYVDYIEQLVRQME